MKLSKRTRSHRLEDISVSKFTNLLPDLWVWRSKEKDYGVDLEVEIFDDDGNSTGLMFYVQLKATDNPELERSVSMKVDRLEYLSSLDAPSMVVRYSDATDAIHFVWISNAFAQIGNPTTKTVTLKFDKNDLWTDQTPAGIPRTLRVLRTIMTNTRRMPIGLTFNGEGQSNAKIFEIKRAISKLQGMSNLISNSRDPERCLPIELSLDSNTLVARIDVISSFAWIMDEITCDEILPRLTYVLAYMAGNYEFFIQSNELVKIIHANNYTTNSRHMASKIAQLSLDRPSIAAEIASRNGLHKQQDAAYLTYIDALLSSELELSTRKEAIERFFAEAIHVHEKTDFQYASTLHYSLANFQMNWGDYKKAIHHFNRARKLENSYVERDYFLRETASCLYFSRKYTMAAKLYVAAHNITPTTQTSICTGDALLYSGQFDGAAKNYREAYETSADEANGVEASLKMWLTAWVAGFYEKNALSGTAILSDRSVWLSVIDQALIEENYETALAAALTEAFRVDDDEGLWADAMSFAFNTKDTHLISGTFSAAIWRCGYEAYALFRENLSKASVPPDGLEMFDQLADGFREIRPSTHTGGVTKRIIGLSHFDSIHEVSERDE